MSRLGAMQTVSMTAQGFGVLLFLIPDDRVCGWFYFQGFKDFLSNQYDKQIWRQTPALTDCSQFVAILERKREHDQLWRQALTCPCKELSWQFDSENNACFACGAVISWKDYQFSLYLFMTPLFFHCSFSLGTKTRHKGWKDFKQKLTKKIMLLYL